eukprot:Hpha_TRINITY_DN16676_c1_g4::TRINITY_DN16676_c1_g4_i1::g.182841::m.182841
MCWDVYTRMLPEAGTVVKLRPTAMNLTGSLRPGEAGVVTSVEGHECTVRGPRGDISVYPTEDVQRAHSCPLCCCCCSSEGLAEKMDDPSLQTSTSRDRRRRRAMSARPRRAAAQQAGTDPDGAPTRARALSTPAPAPLRGALRTRAQSLNKVPSERGLRWQDRQDTPQRGLSGMLGSTVGTLELPPDVPLRNCPSTLGTLDRSDPPGAGNASDVSRYAGEVSRYNPADDPAEVSRYTPVPADVSHCNIILDPSAEQPPPPAAGAHPPSVPSPVTPALTVPAHTAPLYRAPPARAPDTPSSEAAIAPALPLVASEPTEDPPEDNTLAPSDVRARLEAELQRQGLEPLEACALAAAALAHGEAVSCNTPSSRRSASLLEPDGLEDPKERRRAFLESVEAAHTRPKRVNEYPYVSHRLSNSPREQKSRDMLWESAARHLDTAAEVLSPRAARRGL